VIVGSNPTRPTTKFEQMRHATKRLLLDLTAVLIGLSGYFLARYSCSPISGRGCDNPDLQIPFWLGISLVLCSLIIIVYERAIWKNHGENFDLDDNENPF
jgi:hypothetical protein